MKTLQEGNYVSMDNKGNRKSVPMSQKPSSASKASKRPTPPMGGINRSNKAAMDAAGMKNGGMVGMKPCAACKSPGRCKAAGKCMAKGK
jgi:hypothetical protein